MNNETNNRVYIPPRCAHGFMVLNDGCAFFYRFAKPHVPSAKRALRGNDPDLAIDRLIEIGIELITSPEDDNAASLAHCEKYA